MHSKGRSQNVIFGPTWNPLSAALTIMLGLLFLILLLVLMNLTAQPAQGQTYKVIHNFTGGQDGANPYAGVTIDPAGNLYGTAFGGGKGYGTVYQLTHRGSNWVFNPLYSFSGGPDGANPRARVRFGPDGILYGTTAGGGKFVCEGGCGTVFKLTPAPTACKTALCPWTETVLYQFAGIPDGAWPGYGDLIFPPVVAMLGTTTYGGLRDWNGGVAYELIPSGGGWTESVLYSFSGPDGFLPNGVNWDGSGMYPCFYGTTQIGGGSGPYGTVFQRCNDGTFNVLYRFNGNDGNEPMAGVVFYADEALYGATSRGGSGGGGTVFELSGYGWTYSLLYSFTGRGGCGPWATLVWGRDGLYGTTYCDGAYSYGNVFKLTRYPYWTYTSLQDFSGGSDGGNPISNVTFDENGNMYGTTSSGGAYGVGVVWEITP